MSELTSAIRGLLESIFPFVAVAGEITNLRRPQSGHYYFTLKDREAQLRTVLFKQQQKYLSVTPSDGLSVVVRGRLSLYEARGEYQLLVDSMETRGTGDLRAEFELLKNTLADQGLFDQSRKRSLPLLPRQVALITSTEGAAVHDFIRMTSLRFPGFPLVIFPVRVQGDAAPNDIVEALELLNREDNADVIVLCRGGGSLEDLRAFNNEKVARAIYASTIPVVSAVGHEIDFTIADFVADYRAATPTAAAEAVIPDRKRLIKRINRADQYMANSLCALVATFHRRVANQKRLLGDPSLLLNNFHLKLDKSILNLTARQNGVIQRLSQRVEQLRSSAQKAGPEKLMAGKHMREIALRRRILFALTTTIDRKKEGMLKGVALLDAVSPLAVLRRGYSLTRLLPNRAPVYNANEVEPGNHLEIILANGSLLAVVEETRKETNSKPFQTTAQ